MRLHPSRWLTGLVGAIVLLALPGGCALTDGILVDDRLARSPEQAVVHIFYINNPDTPDIRQPSGTGFLISPEGVIATAAHVVEDEGLIDVKFSRVDGSEAIYMPAQVVTLDRDRDVALLKIDHEEGVGPLKVAPLSEEVPRMGDPIAIYGFPESEIVGFEMRRSSGTVSALRSNPLDRSGSHDTRMLEIEARIEPGNSGSPVFGEDGEVVGLVSSRWKTTDAYALAAPIAVVRDLLRERYPEDLEKALGDIQSIPEQYLEEVKRGHELARSMRALFPAGSEGERLVAQLEFCMQRAEEAGEQGMEALSAGRPVEAWRHLQILRHEARAHQQDIAFLKATRRTLDVSRSSNVTPVLRTGSP
ncbi:MAG: hypothetical protein CMH57_04250 [Myxococcales bacterium]|nr:hypothetical protein [Myxococcales bacterium]